MRHRLIAFVAVASGIVSPAARAQSNASPSAQAAFTAILLTPAGALPQIVDVHRTTDSASRGDVAVRFGRYNFKNSPAFNNVGVSGMLRVWRRLSAGATYGIRSCSGCEGSTMASVDVDASLLHKPAAGDIGGDTDVGLQLSGGYGKAKRSDVKAGTFTVSVPLSVSLPQAENSSLTLFLAPSLAYGRLSVAGVTDGASRFVMGAGIGYNFAFGLGAHVSAHRVIIEDSPSQFGFAMSWRFGGT